MLPDLKHVYWFNWSEWSYVVLTEQNVVLNLKLSHHLFFQLFFDMTFISCNRLYFPQWMPAHGKMIFSFIIMDKNITVIIQRIFEIFFKKPYSLNISNYLSHWGIFHWLQQMLMSVFLSKDVALKDIISLNLKVFFFSFNSINLITYFTYWYFVLQSIWGRLFAIWGDHNFAIIDLCTN